MRKGQDLAGSWGAIRPSDASARLANGARRRQGSSRATHARAGLRMLFWGKPARPPVDTREPETRLNLHLAQIAFGSTRPLSPRSTAGHETGVLPNALWSAAAGA